MINTLKNWWVSLQSRERLILILGSVFVTLLLFYQLIWMPWHRAINNMQGYLLKHRTNLVWMQQQGELLEQNGGITTTIAVKGSDKSLLAVVQQTAKANGVSEMIKQMNPRLEGAQVSVVLEETSFSQWVRWVDSLQSEYGVTIVQLAAERESGKPDVAEEVRVTFTRS